LTATNQRIVLLTSDNDLANIISELKALKLRELKVLASLEAIIEQQSPRLSTINTGIHLYQVDDPVVIINKVRRPHNCPANRDDRIGVVTKVADARIDLRTRNGFLTWRVPHNLSPAATDE
jgi:hypothetical protein